MCRAFSPVLAAGLFVFFGSAYSQIAPRSVSLSWTASASPNVRRYKIYRGTASGGPYRLLTSPPVVGASYIDTAVQSGATYYYVVSALGDGNDESGYSNEARAVIPAATPPSVHIDSPTAGATVSGIVTVSGWAIDNTSAPSAAISSVQVLVDGNKVGEAAYGASRPDICALYPGRLGCPNVGFTYLLDTKQLTPGSHMLKVTAIDSDGIPDSGSSTVNITVVAPPSDSFGLRFVNFGLRWEPYTPMTPMPAAETSTITRRCSRAR